MVLLAGGSLLSAAAPAADLFYGGQHYKFHRKSLMPARHHRVPRLGPRRLRHRGPLHRRHDRLVPAHNYISPPLVGQQEQKLERGSARSSTTLIGRRCKSVSEAIMAVKRNYPGSRVLHTRYGKSYGQIVYVVVKIVTRDGRVTTVKVNLC